MHENEKWKDVFGYEGAYQISSLGRLRSKKYTQNYRILKPNITRNGYVTYRLYKFKKQKSYTAHRLLADAFIDNPSGKPQINHINGVKTDNRLENLEWATASENQKHSFSNGLNKNPSGISAKGFRGTVIAKSRLSGEVLKMNGTAEIKGHGFDPGTVYKITKSGGRSTHKGYEFSRVPN